MKAFKRFLRADSFVFYMENMYGFLPGAYTISSIKLSERSKNAWEVPYKVEIH